MLVLDMDLLRRSNPNTLYLFIMIFTDTTHPTMLERSCQTPSQSAESAGTQFSYQGKGYVLSGKKITIIH